MIGAAGLGTAAFLCYRNYKKHRDFYRTAKDVGHMSGAIIGGLVGSRWNVPGSIALGALGANLGEGLVALVSNYYPNPNNQMMLPK